MRRDGADEEMWLPWAALVAAAAIGGGCIVGGMRVAAAIVPDDAASWRIEALFTVAIFLPMLLLTLAAAMVSGVRVLVAGPRPFAMLGLGGAVGAGGIALATGCAGIAGVVQVGHGAGGGAPIAIGSLAMLLQSGSEEALLRGWLQPALATRWRPWVAVAVTALLFAALHLLGGARGAIELVNLALGGVLFGLLRWRSGGLIAPLAAHFAWNWSEGLLLGLDPNPGIGGFGAAFDLDLVGPAIWGGSAAGLNGSVATGIVLIALIAPLLVRRGAAARVP